MDRKQLVSCVERIESHTDDVEKALEGLEMLRDQVEDLIESLVDKTKRPIAVDDDLYVKQQDLLTRINLIRVALIFAQDYNRFIDETTADIRLYVLGEDLKSILKGVAA